ncbi:MAG: adenylosuccinate lyase, partial [Anaerolineales bacterium]|nr:adenylosuccinate lyase [Anaerolineales bacterium]
VKMYSYEDYLSPYTWRYGSQEMRKVWSEINKRRLWRAIWVTLAEVQAEFGLVSAEQVADLKSQVAQVDIKRSLEIEEQIHHDLMAELKSFAESAPTGGGIIHLGATSADIEDNADVLRMRQAFDIVLEKLVKLILSLTGLVEQWAEYPLMGYTHLQPAEPTTLGYRLAFYAQDLFYDWDELRRSRRGLRGKGFKGAVGSGASYGELIGIANLAEFETRLAMKLNLPFFPVTTQVYPRKQDYRVLSSLAGLAGSLHKLAFDLRILQSPAFGELSEPFGGQQVGSSAMPFKRNPINAEKIDSLARSLAQLPRQAWDNAANSLLERTLDDSANRRSILAEGFLVADELLETSLRVVEGLVVDEAAIDRNMAKFGHIVGSERVLMALVKSGADRQLMHECLRELAVQAKGDEKLGEAGVFTQLVTSDEVFLQYLSADQLADLLDTSRYVGDAPARALEFAKIVREQFDKSPG